MATTQKSIIHPSNTANEAALAAMLERVTSQLVEGELEWGRDMGSECDI